MLARPRPAALAAGRTARFAPLETARAQTDGGHVPFGGATFCGFYRRFGVPRFWIIDPESRTIEAYALAEGEHALAARASGDTPASLLPFPDLAFVPASLWP